MNTTSDQLFKLQSNKTYSPCIGKSPYSVAFSSVSAKFMLHRNARPNYIIPVDLTNYYSRTIDITQNCYSMA